MLSAVFCLEPDVQRVHPPTRHLQPAGASCVTAKILAQVCGLNEERWESRQKKNKNRRETIRGEERTGLGGWMYVTHILQVQH